MKLTDYIFQFEDLSNSKEIVFFGGSFNPWHEGHTSCIQLLPSHLPVVIIPDHNPFKDVVKEDQKLTNPNQIIETVKPLNRNTFIYDGFLKRNEKNPTCYWLEETNEAMPLTKISLLLGYDSLENMHKWKEVKSILTNLHCIYVASREENDRKHQDEVDKLKRIHSDFQVKFLGRHAHEHLSSTEFRSK